MYFLILIVYRKYSVQSSIVFFSRIHDFLRFGHLVFSIKFYENDEIKKEREHKQQSIQIENNEMDNHPNEYEFKLDILFNYFILFACITSMFELASINIVQTIRIVLTFTDIHFDISTINDVIEKG